MEFATNAPSGCVGVGGAPGENVWIKAGATDIEPESVLDSSLPVVNIDKGNRSTSGENAFVLGDVASSTALWRRRAAVGAETAFQYGNGQRHRGLRRKDMAARRNGFRFRVDNQSYYTRVLATFEPSES